jgi:hypothetical protein
MKFCSKQFQITHIFTKVCKFEVSLHWDKTWKKELGITHMQKISTIGPQICKNKRNVSTNIELILEIFLAFEN